MTAPSSNWTALKKMLDAESSKDDRPTKRRRLNPDAKKPDTSVKRESTGKVLQPPRTPDVSVGSTPLPPVDGDPDSVENLRAMVLSKVPNEPLTKPTKFLAMDCEMVGVGPDGTESALARVSIVNYSGGVVLDEYVRSQEPVTDYRTWVSGIRPEHMVNAKPFREVQEKVARLLKGHFLVGHALHNDLSALLLTHPPKKTRDTQLYAPFRSGGHSRPALRKLVQKELGLNIQEGEHSSLIDSRATMALYRLHRKEWEASKQGISTKTRAKKELAASSDRASPKRTSSGMATVVTKVVNGKAVSKEIAIASGKKTVKAVKQSVNVKTASGGIRIKDVRHYSGTKESWWQNLE